ncbi:MAG: LamG domain-containing protein, partial [Sediminibacterium sp.]|nr:LamG domain-containing protein [Sediminibacterium sp.]
IKQTKVSKKNISNFLGGGNILQNINVRATGYSGQVRISFDTIVNTTSPISKIVVSNSINPNKDSIGTGAAINFIDGYINGILINNLKDDSNTNFTLNVYLVDGTLNTFTINEIPTVGKINSFRTTSFQMTTSANNLFNNSQNNTDNITLPTLTLLSNYTIETWFKVVDKTKTGQRIFESATSTLGVSDRNDLSIGINSDGSGNLFVKVPGLGTISPTNNVNINNNTWYHVCLVKNNSTAILYFNGTEVLRSTMAMDLTQTLQTVYLGRANYNTETDFSFVGNLQDFRIWNVARDSANIQENMTKDLASLGNTPDLTNYKGLFYWLRLDNNGARKLK